MADPLECPVCLDEFPILQRVKCGHHICQKYYDDINTIDGFLCPMCRYVNNDRSVIDYDNRARKYFRSLISVLRILRREFFVVKNQFLIIPHIYRCPTWTTIPPGIPTQKINLSQLTRAWSIRRSLRNASIWS